MVQYIDKSALVAEIERIEHETNYEPFTGEVLGKRCACRSLLSFLDTLEVKEVDLEKELESWRHNHFHGRRDKEASGEYLERVSQLELSKHFYELGLSVSNSTKVTTPDIEDVLKENGVNPYSKEAKIIKESYFMALEKLKAQKGE